MAYGGVGVCGASGPPVARSGFDFQVALPAGCAAYGGSVCFWLKPPFVKVKFTRLGVE